MPMRFRRHGIPSLWVGRMPKTTHPPCHNGLTGLHINNKSAVVAKILSGIGEMPLTFFGESCMILNVAEILN